MATQPTPTTWTPTPGAPAATDPSNPANNRMAGQVKVLAVIDIILGAIDGLLALGALMVFAIGSAAIRDSEKYGTPHWVAGASTAIGVFAFLVFAAFALVQILAGVRLASYRRSGKGLGLAAAVLQLIGGLVMLFAGGLGLVGVGIGVWGLVALTRRDTDLLLVH